MIYLTFILPDSTTLARSAALKQLLPYLINEAVITIEPYEDKIVVGTREMLWAHNLSVEVSPFMQNVKLSANYLRPA